MPYTVEVAPAAVRQLRKFESAVQKRIVAVLDDLAENPRPHGAVKLTAAASLYRVRTGDFRIIYEIEDRRLIVLVLKIGNRREIYR